MRRRNRYLVPCFVVLLFLSAQSSSAGPGNGYGPVHGRCENCHTGGDPNSLPAAEPVNQLWAPAVSWKRGSFGTEELGSSKRCLSCHDSAMAGAAADTLGERGTAIDLNKGHPVSVDYDTASRKRGRKLIPSVALTSLKLFNGKVECATCHDIHGTRRLRVAARDLCIGCHSV